MLNKYVDNIRSISTSATKIKRLVEFETLSVGHQVVQYTMSSTSTGYLPYLRRNTTDLFGSPNAQQPPICVKNGGRIKGSSGRTDTRADGRADGHTPTNTVLTNGLVRHVLYKTEHNQIFPVRPNHARWFEDTEYTGRHTK